MCPRCNQKGRAVGYKFEVPKINNVKSWKWLEKNWDPWGYRKEIKMEKCKWKRNESQLRRYGEEVNKERMLKIIELEKKHGPSEDWLIDWVDEEQYKEWVKKRVNN